MNGNDGGQRSWARQGGNTQERVAKNPGESRQVSALIFQCVQTH
jgi:hypothetical protein